MDNFNSFGYSFQVKTIYCLINDYEFCNRAFDLIKPDYFNSKSLQWIVKEIFKYYEEYKSLPSLENLKVPYSKMEGDDLLKSEIFSDLKEIFKCNTHSDLDFIKKESVNFALNQELKKAITDSIPLLKSGKYEDIRNRIDYALKKGISLDLGSEYLDTVESRYVENLRNPISSGWECLDNITRGGISAGELAVVLAPTGIGKSWALVHIGAAAVMAGKNVVHYSLELMENYVGLRYDNVISKVSIDNIIPNKEKVVETLKEKVKGDLVIKWYPTKSPTVNTIRNHLDRLKMVGKRVDLVIIDYADLIKVSGDLKHESLQELYEELRGLAGEYKIPIWTASQTNRSGNREDVIDHDTISESWGKVFTADLVMSISRKQKDKINSTARVYVSKNRLGSDGVIFPALFDTSKGIFEMHASDSKRGLEIMGKMSSDEEHDKEYLSKRYSELFNQ